MKVPVSVSMEHELVEKVDSRVGKGNRSAFVVAAVEKALGSTPSTGGPPSSIVRDRVAAQDSAPVSPEPSRSQRLDTARAALAGETPLPKIAPRKSW